MNLFELIKKGGIYYNIRGNTPEETLNSFVNALSISKNIQSKDIQGDLLLKAVLEREALMSTGIGYGIAIPHPRNPIIDDPDGQFAALAFLEKAVDWKSLDKNAVDTLFLIVSSSAKFHLRVLSGISYLCKDENFRSLLKEKPAQESIIKFIKEAEETWN